MTISRRMFLAGLGAGALWSAVPPTGFRVIGAVPAPAAPATTRVGLDLATATAHTFRPHLGSSFRLQRPGHRSLELTLAQVAQAPPDGGLTDSFSLGFTAARPPGLGQATRTLEHAVLGEFAIFLVPAGPRQLEAVINHMIR